MEVFTGDGQVSNDVVAFADANIIPFLEIYGDPTANFSPDVKHRSIQKLRPIRYNGRSSPELSDSGVGILLPGENVESLELGFLAQLACAEAAEECGGGGPVRDVNCGLPESGVTGNWSSVRSEMDAVCTHLVSEANLLEDELGSSSDGGCKLSKANKEPLVRKSKRKTRKRLELLMESMMMKVMEKQEQMHKQLIMMIQKKEDESINREAAWRKKLIEMNNRDEGVRAQEISRNLALIVFIQNLLGQEIEIPSSFQAPCLVKEEGQIRNEDSSNRRWQKSEVQALITVRAALDCKFLRSPKSYAVWEEVAAELSKMGYSWTATKCKQKWENINKYYKRHLQKGKMHPDNGTSCQYFQELDVLHKNGLIDP